VAGKCNYCSVIYKANPNKNGMKDLKNYFPRCSQNPNKSKQTNTNSVDIQKGSKQWWWGS